MTLFASDIWKPLSIVLLAVVVGGCSGMTYGTGVSPGKQTLEDITGLVSLGSKDKQPIDYAPRPPIVAPPPTADLPKPGESTTAVADWPKDPDEIAREKKLAAAPKNAETTTEVLADPGFRLPKSSTPTNHYPNEDPTSAKNQIFQAQQARTEAKQLFANAKAGAGGAVDANGNPVRTYLTEPPADYRVPDPASPEAFAAAKNQKWWQIFKKKDASAPPPTDAIPDVTQ